LNRYQIGNTRYFISATEHGFEIYHHRVGKKEGQPVDEYEFRHQYHSLTAAFEKICQILLSEIELQSTKLVELDLLVAYQQALQELSDLIPTAVKLEDYRDSLIDSIRKEISHG
jgi:hypothetical protein